MSEWCDERLGEKYSTIYSSLFIHTKSLQLIMQQENDVRAETVGFIQLFSLHLVLTKMDVQKKKPHTHRQPDRTFHNCRALKTKVLRYQTLINLSIGELAGSEMVKLSVGKFNSVFSTHRCCVRTYC